MTREEAITEFLEEIEIFGGEHREAMLVAIEALKEPQGCDMTITQEERVGEWTARRTSLEFVCSNCGEACWRDFHYCPNCGAKMKGGNNG